MALLGRAVVAIWNDILPEGKANFIEWHNREHIPERVGIPGFLRGRRYDAYYGDPAYYTLYEAEDAGVLVGKDYLERLNNPTRWTKEATSAFRNTTRGVCETVFSKGIGDGGVMMTLRFDAEAEKRESLSDYLGKRLGEVSGHYAISGVHLCIADAAASGIETAEKKGREVGVPNWIVMIEGSETAAVDAATDHLLHGGLVAHGAIEEPVRGLYRLEYCLTDFAR
ncbi:MULTISPECIES: DUF4286 family protein [unclassified Chelatococcus]|uniref:DUF4286 family protein n=1 Tax=unclassified Chelatococcus TaxID=2638111 RepID=UPI001BCC3BDB|nr:MULTISPECIES: DUF4286 family protein [unclassified Chelatococcus]MBS7695861.1 hypothetical protein [Chelatococcus sp. YT9]MBX3555764.1 hypothetical protein [Chelatococcus sp.]